MGASIGIDLGSTNCVVAGPDDVNGRIAIISDDQGGYEFPACVVVDDDGELLAGQHAQMLRRDRENVYSKRRIARGDTASHVDAPGVNAIQAATTLLLHLRESTERVLGEPVERAAIGVPASWTSAAIASLREAAENAGFHSPTFIPEPIAAVTSATKDQAFSGRRILTFDLGGGKFETTIVEARDDGWTIQSFRTDDALGGETLDRRVVSWLWEQLLKEGYDLPDTPAEQSPHPMVTKLALHAEEAKKQLSFADSARVSIPSLGRDRRGRTVSLQTDLKRRDFEQLIANDVDRAVSQCQRMLLEQGLRIEDIDQILLLGGSSRIPYVRQQLEEALSSPVQLPRDWHHVARGAARFAMQAADAPTHARAQAIQLFRQTRAELAKLLHSGQDPNVLFACQHELDVLERQAQYADDSYNHGLWQATTQRLTELYARLQDLRWRQLGPREQTFIFLQSAASELAELDSLARARPPSPAIDQALSQLRQLLLKLDACRSQDSQESFAATQPLLAAATHQIQRIRGMLCAESIRSEVRSSSDPPVPRESQRPDSARPRAGSPELPAENVDRVHFSATSPTLVTPGLTFLLDVWAHLDQQRPQVIARAKEALGGADILIQSKGPLQVTRGTVLTVRVAIERLVVPDPEDTILWVGDVGNAQFRVDVPVDVVVGPCPGTAGIYIDGIRVAKLQFQIVIGGQANSTAAIPLKQERHQRAFASYAREDLDQVLGRLQGMQKCSPSLEIFLDVLTLRSGEEWQAALDREITRSDVFYLFWSQHARQSQWVTWEWKHALGRRGIDFIDPVPMADPRDVPPPPELSTKHFNDWVLAFLRKA